MFLLDRECDIGDIGIFGKGQYTVQTFPAFSNRKILIIFFPTDNRTGVKTMPAFKSDIRKTTFQMLDLFINRMTLIMKNKCKNIEWSMWLICSKITRFINKNTETAHDLHSQIKMAGNIPAAGGPGSCDQPVFPYQYFTISLRKNQYFSRKI